MRVPKINAGLTALLATTVVVSVSVPAPVLPEWRPVSSADLLTNGDFEDPAVWETDSVDQFDSGSTDITGWTVGPNSVDLTTENYWKPVSGHQSLDLAGDTPGSVTQTITTTPGTNYTLQWSYTGNPNCGQPVKSMNVTWNGVLVDTVTANTTGHDNAAPGWQQAQVNVTATGTTSSVTFADATIDRTQCGAALDGVSLVATAAGPPHFTVANAGLGALAGAVYSAAFFASGAPQYTLTGAPAWLSITANGAVSGTPPAGTTGFTYSVAATNGLGSATTGPYTVTVAPAAAVSGTIVHSGLTGAPAAGAFVEACPVGGGGCETTTTPGDGTFTVNAPVGASVVVSAYPAPGTNDVASSTEPLAVPAAGVRQVTLALNGTGPLPSGLTINGSSAPTVYWSDPASAVLTGCTGGYASVTVTGQNVSTGAMSSTITPLAETPPGSGTYTGTIPPQEPVHGPVDVESSVVCAPASALVPSVGPAAGGTTVVVTGTGFTGATAVKFGTATATGLSPLSDEAVQVVAPAGTGTVPVTVVTPAAPAGIAAGQYTYDGVGAVSPAAGSVAGGTWVDITGAGLLSVTGVAFGGVPAQAIQPVSDTEVEALSPAGTGTVDVTVTSVYGGTTATVAADRFTYGGAAAATVVAPVRAAAVKANAVTPESLAEKIRDYVYEHSELGSLTQRMQAAMDEVHPITNCKEGQELLKKDIIKQLEPALAAIKAYLIPIFRTAVIQFVEAAGIVSGGSGLLIGAIVYALVPTLVNWLVDTAAEKAVEALMKKFGLDCPPDLPEPPKGGPPGDGGLCVVLKCGQFHGDALIDPSGTVLDSNGNPVAGATVTILRAGTAVGPFTAVSASSPGIRPATNPETTGADGVFHWDVASGWYEVAATTAGCSAPVTIGPYPVPPPQVGLTITVPCAAAAPAPRPAVTGISQATGPAAGGTTLTVLGTGFTPASTVAFGAKAATAVTFVSARALTVTSPAGAGKVDVTVANGSSVSTTSAAFFYGSPPTVTGVAPASGGTAVTVTGTGFTGATAVVFGGVPAAQYTVTSDTAITATVPAQPPGAVDVQVITPAGVSATGAGDRYTYPLVFTADTPPATASVGVAYSYTYAAPGATAYTMASGALPPGLALNSATGVLAGTPSTAGAFTFTVAASGGTAGKVVAPAATITVTAPAPAGPAADGQASATGRGKATARLTTASAGDLIVAFVAADSPCGQAQRATVSGGGLMWTLVRRTDTAFGMADVWQARATTRLDQAAITSTLWRPGFTESLTVVAFTNAHGIGRSAGASGWFGAPSASLTTTLANSWVYAVGVDVTGAIARTPGPDQALVTQTVDPRLRDTFWVQRRTAPIPKAGTKVTINDTFPTRDMWDLTVVEIA